MAGENPRSKNDQSAIISTTWTTRMAIRAIRDHTVAYSASAADATNSATMISIPVTAPGAEPCRLGIGTGGGVGACKDEPASVRRATTTSRP